jgi:hypothetical protein
MAAIPEIIEDSIYIDSLENENITRNPDVKSYDYYVIGLKIGGEDYTVKAVIANKKNEESYYDHKLTQIGKKRLLSEIESSSNSQNGEISSSPSITEYKNKRLFLLLQVNSSKVLDKNREPFEEYLNTFQYQGQETFPETLEKAKQWDYLMSENWVSELTGEEFQKDEVSLVDKVTQYYKDNYNRQVEREDFGTVLLNKAGIKSSIGHKINRKKAAAFAAVPDIIQKGIIINEQTNWKGRGKDTFVIAAPLKIGNESYTGIVIVTKSIDTNQFYLHEVVLQKSLRDTTFQDLSHRRGNDTEGNLVAGTENTVGVNFLQQNLAKQANLQDEVNDLKQDLQSKDSLVKILKNIIQEKQIVEKYQTNL